MRAFALALLVPASPAAAQLPGTGFDVDSYTVTLTPDFAMETVSGQETIILRSTDIDLRAIAFSPNALIISAATIDGIPATVARDDQAVRLTPAKPLRKDRRVTLRFAFTGKPARGVTFTPTSVVTSYFACDWMICLQDSPGDKADFALNLRLPHGLTSLATGRMVGPHKWRSTRPYSPYLFAFAAGPFDRVIERRGAFTLTYLGAPASPALLRQRFADTADMVAFLSDKAGLNLPGGTYAQLLVPGDEAQEAATYSILGAETLDAEQADPSSAWAIVHELAHQYWGNLVTCATWQDFWLNEGITTFMTAAWRGHRFGPAAYDAELAVATRRLARARDEGWDRPLAFRGPYPSLRTRRAIQYSKGALFMHTLRIELGEDVFWAGLKRFTRAHAGGTVVSADFQHAMEQASGRDLSALFAKWVYDG